MPSRLGKRKDYNLVDDAHDSRVPLHNEDAFRHGIHFKAKYIGTLDVPRPTGRMEIVVAMRRIRYEFKAKAIKKRKVNIRVSTDGVKVVLRKKKKKKEWAWDLDRMLIMHDPIYRIFYVSHDSHDLKIWSFIARDGSSNVFRCNVFKSSKKSQAMRIVRTVGQAFEVCHKLNIGPPVKKDENTNKEKAKATNSDNKDKPADVVDGSKDDKTEESATDKTTTSTTNGETETQVSLSPEAEPAAGSKVVPKLKSVSEPISILQSVDSKTPLSTHHQLQLSQKKIQQAEHQAEVAVAQVQLLKDQLAVETTARIEAQARNHQLMVQNHELLQQMTDLVAKLAEVEAKLNNTTNDEIYSFGLSRLMVDATTPASGTVDMPLIMNSDLTKVSPLMDTSLFANVNTSSMPTPDLSKHSNGQLATTDTSTSTITKSSNASGSVRTKHSRKMGRIMDGDVSGSSSDSSSDDDDAPVHMASESNTVKNIGMDKIATSLANGSALMDQTADTSIWTSGLVTPEKILSGQGYQQSSMSFDELSMNTTVNDSNLSNGYTLSPIFTTGGNAESQSSFQHFSITDVDTSLRIEETPKKSQNSITKSYSASADMQQKQGQPIPAMSHSSGDINSQNKTSKNVIKWTQVTEKESPMEDSFSSELPDHSSNKSSDSILTPRLEPPPRVKRVQSGRPQPDHHRPRPEAQLTTTEVTSPTSTITNITSPKLVDTSDSDMEIPPKFAKYHGQGVKLSQSSFGYGSDPLLSRFDPLLSKSKSFDQNSPSLAPKITQEQKSTILSPVQDVGRSNPFLYITPKTPESSKYCNPVNPVDLSKSYSELDQSSPAQMSGIFMSPQEYESKLRYEPLSKQQASEWHRTTETTATRLNSSFHAGDENHKSGSKSSSRSDTRGPLQVYRTYSDLPSTLTPVKTTVPLPHEKNLDNITLQSLGSYNSNTNNNIATSGLYKEPPSIDGNISLLDDLFISEVEEKSPAKDGADNVSESRLPKHGTSNEVSLLQSSDAFSEVLSISSGTVTSVVQTECSETITFSESSVEVALKNSEVVSDINRSMPVSESNQVSVGSNSDSGVSGCGGFKLDREITNSPSMLHDDS